jgi:hypothetical protein
MFSQFWHNRRACRNGFVSSGSSSEFFIDGMKVHKHMAYNAIIFIARSRTGQLGKLRSGLYPAIISWQLALCKASSSTASFSETDIKKILDNGRKRAKAALRGFFNVTRT